MGRMSKVLSDDCASLLVKIKERVRAAQYQALRTVNKELVGLYWDIGQFIVERQIDSKHGAAIAERLAADLQQEFPGMSGFSRRNVFDMREFHLSYRDQPICATTGCTNRLVS